MSVHNVTLNEEFFNKVFVREELSLATLQEDASIDNIPEGGFINKDSHLLVFVDRYADEYYEEENNEPDYENYFFDQDDDNTEEF
jgi:hypothetical protein